MLYAGLHDLTPILGRVSQVLNTGFNEILRGKYNTGCISGTT
jgi:hypothetical protein